MNLQRLWTDEVMQELNPSEKLFYFYVLTAPGRSSESKSYEIDLNDFSKHTGFSIEVIQVLIRRFHQEYCLINYENGVMTVGGIHG